MHRILPKLIVIFMHSRQLLLWLGHQGTVHGSQGLEEAVLEISYEVHDLVPEIGRAKDNHGRL